MAQEDHLSAVRDYFSNEFPEWKVEQVYESGSKMHVFTLTRAGAVHKALIMDDFLNTHDGPRIAALLKQFLLAEHMRDLGNTPVRVTNQGLKLDFE